MRARGCRAGLMLVVFLSLSGCIIYAPNRGGWQTDPIELDFGGQVSHDLHLAVPAETAFDCSRRTAGEIGLSVESTRTDRKGAKLICRTATGRKVRVDIIAKNVGSEWEVHCDGQDASIGESFAGRMRQNLSAAPIAANPQISNGIQQVSAVTNGPATPNQTGTGESARPTTTSRPPASELPK